MGLEFCHIDENEISVLVLIYIPFIISEVEHSFIGLKAISGFFIIVIFYKSFDQIFAHFF